MGIRKFLSKYIIMGVLILVAAAAVFYYLIYLPYQAAKETGHIIAQQMDENLNITPRVNIENFTVIEAVAPVLEIAVISQQVQHTYHYKDKWLGSTKELETRGVFLAKAGFDLKKQIFVIDIKQVESPEPGPFQIEITLPPAEILSFTTQAYKLLRDEDGWWNELTKKEREQAINRVREDALLKVIHEGILDAAEESMEKQLTDIIKNSNIAGNIGQIRFNYLVAAETDSLVLNPREKLLE